MTKKPPKTPKLTPAEQRAIDYADKLLAGGCSEEYIAAKLKILGWQDHFRAAIRKLGLAKPETVH